MIFNRKNKDKDKDKDKEQPTDKQSYDKANLMETGSSLLVAVSDNMSKAAPVIALTGIGLPLAAGIYAAGIMADKMAAKNKMMRMVTDCKHILGTCYSNYNAMLKTLSWYLDVINEIKDKVKNEDDLKKVDAVYNYMINAKLEKGILNKISQKIELITGLIKDVDMDKNRSRIQKVASSFYRNMYGKYYRQELTSELSTFNALFLSFQEKFKVLERSYRTKIRRLKISEIITEENTIQIDETIDGLYKEFIDENIDGLISNTKSAIEKAGLVEQMDMYVEKTTEVAAKHIEGKFNKDEIKDDKKGGKFTLKINTKKKRRTKNTRRRK